MTNHKTWVSKQCIRHDDYIQQKQQKQQKTNERVSHHCRNQLTEMTKQGEIVTMGELDKTMTMEDEAVLAGDNGVAVGVGGDMEDGILMGAADRLETILLQKEEIVQTLLSLKAEILSGNNEKITMFVNPW